MAVELATRPTTIFDLPHLVDTALSSEQRKVFYRIFELQSSETPLNFHSSGVLSFLAKERFKTDEDNLRQRRSLRITNIVLDEETLLNPLRANRPLQAAPGNQIAALEENNPEGNCDFCHPQERTPQDPFQAVESEHCLTIANALSYDAMHSLVIPKFVHNPDGITEEILKDMISTGKEWFRLANSFNPRARYPLAILNVLPRAGGSVFHPHLQVLLAEDRPYQKVEDLRRRMSDYQFYNDAPYLDQLSFASQSLGLVFDVGSAHIIFNLAPKKEKEVIIYESGSSGLPNGDLSKATFDVINWWRRDLGVTSYNMAMYMPPLGECLDKGDWCNFYPFIRLVERGKEGAATSDFGAMEIFGPSVVSADPLRLAASFAEYQEKQALAA